MKQEKTLFLSPSSRQNYSPDKFGGGVLWHPLKLLQNLVRIQTGDIQAGTALKAQFVPQ